MEWRIARAREDVHDVVLTSEAVVGGGGKVVERRWRKMVGVREMRRRPENSSASWASVFGVPGARKLLEGEAAGVLVRRGDFSSNDRLLDGRGALRSR